MSSLCSHVYWISQYLCQGCVRISSNQEVCCFFIFSYIYFTTKLVLVFRTFLIYFCCFDFWCVIYPTAIARNFADFPVRIDGFSNISKNYVSSGQHFDHSYILPGVMRREIPLKKPKQFTGFKELWYTNNQTNKQTPLHRRNVLLFLIIFYIWKIKKFLCKINFL